MVLFLHTPFMMSSPTVWLKFMNYLLKPLGVYAKFNLATDLLKVAPRSVLP